MKVSVVIAVIISMGSYDSLTESQTCEPCDDRHKPKSSRAPEPGRAAFDCLRAQTLDYCGQPVEAVFIPGMRDCRHVFDTALRVLGKTIRNLFD